MAGYKVKADCPCDNPIFIAIPTKTQNAAEVRYFPCCKCDLCIARMQLFFSEFINGEDEE